MTHNPYVKCKICGGHGHYPKLERIGDQTVERPVKCEHCTNGWINTDKLRPKPLHDKWGRPLDRFGKVIKNAEYEEWQRKFRRDELIKEMNG